MKVKRGRHGVKNSLHSTVKNADKGDKSGLGHESGFIALRREAYAP
jgi:hypothetical protein